MSSGVGAGVAFPSRRLPANHRQSPLNSDILFLAALVVRLTWSSIDARLRRLTGSPPYVGGGSLTCRCCRGAVGSSPVRVNINPYQAPTRAILTVPCGRGRKVRTAPNYTLTICYHYGVENVTNAHLLYANRSAHMGSPGFVSIRATRTAVTAILLTVLCVSSSKIDRASVVSRHNVLVTAKDVSQLKPLDVLSLGNGAFAFNIDPATGLQSLNATYNVDGGFGTATMSDWGWHSSPFNPGVEPFRDFKYTALQTAGRNTTTPYPIDGNTEEGRWLRANPHRLNLGQLGFKSWGPPLAQRLSNMTGRLDVFRGTHQARFILDGSTEAAAPLPPYTTLPTLDGGSSQSTNPSPGTFQGHGRHAGAS